MDNQFKIIIPFMNCAKWIGECAAMIKAQTYENFKCILIDDYSDDNSYQIVRKIVGDDFRFVLKRNEKNRGALNNIVDGIGEICDDNNDIIVLVDGDDKLYDSNVLKYLNDIYYQDPNVWLTYGSYIELSDLNKIDFLGNGGCNQLISDVSVIRKEKINFSHLRTFRYFLWKNVNNEDLKNDKNGYIRAAWDVAMTLPMIEMSGLDRIKRIDKILYIYNNQNPLNEHKVAKKLQLEEDQYIRNKSSYERIN